MEEIGVAKIMIIVGLLPAVEMGKSNYISK